MSYVHRRILEVRLYDKAPEDPRSDLDELVVAVLPTLTGAVELEELPETVRGALAEYGVETYVLQDERGYRRWGERQSLQEVVLSVPSAGCEPALDDAVRALVEHLVTWARESRRRERRKLAGELAEVTPPYATPSIENREPSGIEPDIALSLARSYVSDRFRASEDDLLVEEVHQTSEETLVVLRETRSPRAYRVEVSDSSNLIRFARVKTASAAADYPPRS